MSRVGMTLLTDATEMLLCGVQATVREDHEAGVKRVTIETTVPKLLKAVEQAALHVHAYYPEQGEPALTAWRLERAGESARLVHEDDAVTVTSSSGFTWETRTMPDGSSERVLPIGTCTISPEGAAVLRRLMAYAGLARARAALAAAVKAQDPDRHFRGLPESPEVIAAYDAVRAAEGEVARLEREGRR